MGGCLSYEEVTENNFLVSSARWRNCGSRDPDHVRHRSALELRKADHIVG